MDQAANEPKVTRKSLMQDFNALLFRHAAELAAHQERVRAFEAVEANKDTEK
jgi:hypothetical protein